MLPLSDSAFGDSIVLITEPENPGVAVGDATLAAVSGAVEPSSPSGDSKDKVETASFAGAGAAAAPLPTDFGVRNGRGGEAGDAGF